MERLIFLCDADSGGASAIVDSARKLLRINGCALCAITHGLATEKREMRSCRQELEVPVDYLHRNDRLTCGREAASRTRIRPMQHLSELKGTRWRGSSELWLDPLGDQAARCDCTIAVEGGALHYRWSHDGKAHEGSLSLRDGGADFKDTFHQPEPMLCRTVEGAPGLLQVQGSYGPEAEWGWRIGLSLRAPTGELVLQMTNIAPWGEEARAVRMVCQREDAEAPA